MPSAKKNPADADGATQTRSYIATLAPETRKLFKQLREAILSAAPKATDHFSYGIPAFKLDAKPFVWYAAFKNHLSLYPFTAAIRLKYAAELKGYKTSTGTIQFPLDKPLPVALVKKLVKARIAELRMKTKD